MATISSTNTTNRIKVSNDGAKYYGDLAKKYRDEAQKEKHLSKNLAFYTLSGIPGR